MRDIISESTRHLCEVVIRLRWPRGAKSYTHDPPDVSLCDYKCGSRCVASLLKNFGGREQRATPSCSASRTDHRGKASTRWWTVVEECISSQSDKDLVRPGQTNCRSPESRKASKRFAARCIQGDLEEMSMIDPVAVVEMGRSRAAPSAGKQAKEGELYFAAVSAATQNRHLVATMPFQSVVGPDRGLRNRLQTPPGSFQYHHHAQTNGL